MEHLIPVLDIATTCLYVISIIILLWGVVISVKDFLISHLQRSSKIERLEKMQKNKIHLGGYILLSLEILIVADIIESILRPTLEDIIRLAAIVTIRTVISYFLNKEIRDAQGWNEKKEK